MAIANFLQTVGGRKTTGYSDGAIPMQSSAVVSAIGGRFFTFDGSGNAAMTAATDTHIDGWIDTCYAIDHNGTNSKNSSTPITCSATAGATALAGSRDVKVTDSAYWIPSADTLTAAYKGAASDLIVTTNIQYLKPTVTTHKHVIVVDVDIVNGLALVYANPAAS